MGKRSKTERGKAMVNMGNKKLALIYILRILEEHSDSDHPLTQSVIAQKLEKDYGIILERKAVSRNLSLLREAGYEIASVATGNYLDEREFDNSELRLMIDGVLSSRYVTERQAKHLADRISDLSNKYFRSHVKHIHSLYDYQKTENNTVFYALELIDEAIDEGRKISFDCYANKIVNDRIGLVRIGRQTLSPIQMVIKNQFYYLIGATDDSPSPVVKSYRLDLISNPIIEEERSIDRDILAKYGRDMDLKELLSSNPYMNIKGLRSDRASFLCSPSDIELVAEELGEDLSISRIRSKSEKAGPDMELVRVTLKISPEDLVAFACRYPQRIFITSPEAAVRYQEQLYEGHLAIAKKIREYDN